MAGASLGGVGFSIEWGRGSTQDGEVQVVGEEWLIEGAKTELGKSEGGRGWGMIESTFESKPESNKAEWEVSKGGKRWGKVIFE